MSAVPLKRLRLELDRDVRGRWFFARAVRGSLSVPEYLDLLAQLEGLTRIAGGAEAEHLERLRDQDVANLANRAGADLAPDLGARRERGFEPLPFTMDLPLCPSLEYLAWLVQHEAWPRSDVSLQVALAVLGTSWASDAADALAERFQGSGAFLEEVALAGPRASSALEQPLDALLADPQPIHAVTELVRGAFLGLATYLDSTWRTPVLSAGPALKERLR